MLDTIKKRCYISSSIYDDEINSLINACILDCEKTGISKSIFLEKEDGSYNDLALNCITNYVKAHRGNDRYDTDKYIKIYESIRDKMSLSKEFSMENINEL